VHSIACCDLDVSQCQRNQTKQVKNTVMMQVLAIHKESSQSRHGSRYTAKPAVIRPKEVPKSNQLATMLALPNAAAFNNHKRRDLQIESSEIPQLITRSSRSSA